MICLNYNFCKDGIMVRSIVQTVRQVNGGPIEKTIIIKKDDNMAEELTDQELEQIMKEIGNMDDEELEYIGDEDLDNEEVDDVEPEEIEIDDEDFTEDYI